MSGFAPRAVIEEIRNRFPAWGALRDVRPVAGGLSGASLFHVVAEAGEYGVKLTPASKLSLPTLNARHEAIRAIDDGQWHRIFPRLESDRHGATAWSATCLDEACFGEAREWFRFDVPDDDYAASRSEEKTRQLAPACELLARFHQRGSAVRLSPVATAELTAPTPFPQRYLGELARIVPERVAAVRGRLATAPSGIRYFGERYLSRLPEIASQVSGALASLPGTPAALRLCLRDVHRNNIAYRGGVATAILDWDAMRFDRRIADFARLAVSYELSSDLTRRQAAEATENACRTAGPDQTLTDWERAALAPALRAQLWIPPLNWMEWLYVERREFVDPVAAYARLAQSLVKAAADDVTEFDA